MYNHIQCSECRVRAATERNKSSGKDGAFIHTFDSLSPEIYTGMRIRCACTVQCRIVTRDFTPDRTGTGLPGCG